MKSRIYCCVLVLLFMLGSCGVAPTVQPTRPLSSTPHATETLQPMQTLTPTETPTLQPTITYTALPTSSIVFPKACGRVMFGKPGTQSQDKTHPVLVQGTVILCTDLFLDDADNFLKSIPVPQSMLDLDAGSSEPDHADMMLYISGRHYLFFTTFSIHQALEREWAIPAEREPTFDECETLSDLFGGDNEPAYVCVITNAGHVARIKMEQYSPFKSIYSVMISFITWDVAPRTPFPTPKPCIDFPIVCRVENIPTHTSTPTPTP